MLTGFILSLEIVGVKWRTTACILYQIPFAIGHASLGLFGYYIRDWRILQITISTPALVLLSFYWILPESPRWLLSVGRVDEAIEILKYGAKMNGAAGTETEAAHLELLEIARQNCVFRCRKGGNIKELFKTKDTIIKIISTSIIWSVIGFCYFGVAQYMAHIGGNMFMNIAISGLIQIPATISALFIMEWKRLGRKGTLILFLAICAASMLSILTLPPHHYWVAGCIGILSISVTFSVAYIYTGELFPTIVRNSAMGSCSMCARFGSMAAPFAASLGKYNNRITPTVFGIMPIVAICVCMLLSETLGRRLLNTTEEENEEIHEQQEVTTIAYRPITPVVPAAESHV